MLAVFDDLCAVDEDVTDADSILMRLLEGRVVLNFCRVKHHHISKVTGL